MSAFYSIKDPIKYEGPNSRSELAFRWYNPDQLVMGKKMRDHMRFAIAYWHTLCWPGGDPFGGDTFMRQWHHMSDDMAAARMKADLMFETLELLERRLLLLPRPRHRARGQVAEGVQRQRHRDRQDLREEDGGEEQEAPVGHRQHVLQPPLHGGCGHQSRSGRLRLLRSAGEALHGRDQGSRRRQLRHVGRPRGLRDAGQHQHRP